MVISVGCQADRPQTDVVHQDESAPKDEAAGNEANKVEGLLGNCGQRHAGDCDRYKHRNDNAEHILCKNDW